MDQEHEEGGRGEFRRMMASREVDVPAIEEVQPEEEEEDETASAPILPSLKHSSLLPLLPLTFGNWNWMFDAVAELTRPSALNPPPNSNDATLTVPELAYLPGTTKKRDTLTSRLSRLAIPFSSQTRPPPLPPIAPLQIPERKRRPSSAMFPNTPLTVDTFSASLSRKSRRFSAPGQTPTSATFTVVDREWEEVDFKGTDSKDNDLWWERESEREEEEEFEKEKKAIARSGSVVHEKRRKMSRDNTRGMMNIKVIKEEEGEEENTNRKPTRTQSRPACSSVRASKRCLPFPPSPCSSSPSSYAHSQV